ncbi:VOC family protein [Xenophilus arseniciresistens]|uniref:VOC family protein n=1 Tax=Xenophilus arseniciresistens TaxID=1283306 RepID=A0AAE3NET3_9BURK|nr:VOC family protein [Xenophilus arseniciresistens]MDA7418274.1 VOC family protein [Xenophilus arseniciresistens]
MTPNKTDGAPGGPAQGAVPAPFLRLRQICLVARELDAVVQDLCAVFGVQVCHRDPEVGQFGLHNALMPFGQQFLEVVAPVREGTTAGRYLERRGGDGGYMVILDSEALPRWRTHVADIGVRIAAPLALGDYEGMQLHPRDTGGALLEINTTLNGSDLDGPYWPAGAHWQQHVSTARVAGFAGAVLQSTQPQALAERWSRILQRPVRHSGRQWETAVDNAVLRFAPETDGRGEGLAAVVLRTHDAAAIRATAQARGLPVETNSVMVCGVRFVLAED